MLRLICATLALVLTFAAAPATAKEHVKLPGAKKIEVPLKELPKAVVRDITAQLKEMGIEANEEMAMGADTSSCPSNCNDSTGGGYCFCQPDSGGSCPSGTEKQGSPGQEYCRVQRPKSGIIGGGLREPAQIQTPTGF